MTEYYDAVAMESVEVTVGEINRRVKLINAEINHHRSLNRAGGTHIQLLLRVEEMLCGLAPMLMAVLAIITEVNAQEGR